MVMISRSQHMNMFRDGSEFDPQCDYLFDFLVSLPCCQCYNTVHELRLFDTSALQFLIYLARQGQSIVGPFDVVIVIDSYSCTECIRVCQISVLFAIFSFFLSHSLPGGHVVPAPAARKKLHSISISISSSTNPQPQPQPQPQSPANFRSHDNVNNHHN